MDCFYNADGVLVKAIVTAGPTKAETVSVISGRTIIDAGPPGLFVYFAITLLEQYAICVRIGNIERYFFL